MTKGRVEQAHGDEDLMKEPENAQLIPYWCQECETFHYIVDRPARHLRLEPFGPSEWFGGPFPEENE